MCSPARRYAFLPGDVGGRYLPGADRERAARDADVLRPAARGSGDGGLAARCVGVEHQVSIVGDWKSPV